MKLTLSTQRNALSSVVLDCAASRTCFVSIAGSIQSPFTGALNADPNKTVRCLEVNSTSLQSIKGSSIQRQGVQGGGGLNPGDSLFPPASLSLEMGG